MSANSISNKTYAYTQPTSYAEKQEPLNNFEEKIPFQNDTINSEIFTSRTTLGPTQTAQKERAVFSKTLNPPQHLYDTRGAHVHRKGTEFCVYAPAAKSINLILTAYQREEHRLPMQKNAGGTWSICTNKAKEGRSYRYRVEDCNGKVTYRTDPFSFSTIDNGKCLESVVSKVDSYAWNDADWMAQRALRNPLESPQAVYELYPQCWKKKNGKPLNYRDFAPELINYCKKMHFSHVELYGVLDNKSGWGYQVLNFFAPNHAMGTSSDFQFLVDQLHQNNIGVILDWIPAHYKHDFLEASLHNFDGTDLFSAGDSEWGTVLFDFSKAETRRLLEASALYWLDKMHIDRIRVDAVSHIVRRDRKEYKPGISFLKKLNSTIKTEFPDVVMVAEDTTNFPNLTKSIPEGGLGFDLKWNIRAGNDMRNFLKTPTNERPSHHQKKFVDYLTHVKRGEKALITHSHDEPANRNGADHYPVEKDQTLYQIDALTNTFEKFADMRNFFAWQILAPSRGYLIHMGDEFGQKRSWDAGVSSKKGAMQWDLLNPSSKEQDSSYHIGLQTWVSDLNEFYCNTPAFWKKGEQGFELCCEHRNNNVIAYERSVKGEASVWVVHNFSQGKWPQYDITLGSGRSLSHGDNLEEIFNSNHLRYSGNNKYGNADIQIKGDSKRKSLVASIAIPPLSTIVFRKKR